MAAFIGWVDANLSNSPVKRGNPALIAGGLAREFAQHWTKATTDGDGTIYYLAEVPSNAVLTSLLLNNAALTGCTSADFGFLKTDGTSPAAGAVNCLMSAVDINAGKAIGSEQNGLAAIAIGNLGQKVWELLGLTIKTKDETYLLVMRLNTAGSAAGALGVRGRWIQG